MECSKLSCPIFRSVVMRPMRPVILFICICVGMQAHCTSKHVETQLESDGSVQVVQFGATDTIAIRYVAVNYQTGMLSARAGEHKVFGFSSFSNVLMQGMMCSRVLTFVVLLFHRGHARNCASPRLLQRDSEGG